MKEIPLTKGMVAIVDDEDYEGLIRYKWGAFHRRTGNCWYAFTKINRKNVFMHNLILGSLPHQDIDHVDLNGLHNTRDNLRPGSRSQNMANRGSTVANTSGYKGVWKKNIGRPWEAGIKVNYRTVYLGTFDTPQEAAAAYDKAAIHHFGEFALTNAMLGLL